MAASTAGDFWMGIGWLWHFTHADDSDALRSRNEDRAAAVYARWRALHRLAISPARRLRDAGRERRYARELDALTDDVLHDVGLRRHVDGSVVAAPREWNRRCVAETQASPSIVDRQRTSGRPPGLEPGNELDSRPHSSLPSSIDRPEVASHHDECGRRAA